jgi:hypothetical protein
MGSSVSQTAIGLCRQPGAAIIRSPRPEKIRQAMITVTLCLRRLTKVAPTIWQMTMEGALAMS